MIDTLKFKIPLNAEKYFYFRDKSETQTFKDGQVKKWHYPVKLPSYDKNINLLGYDESSYVFLEFNPQKFLKASNVYGSSLDEIEAIVEEVCCYLNSEFNLNTNTGVWLLTRLDDAYMWDYGDFESANLVFSVLKNFTDKVVSTTCYKGRSKFYLKYPELLVHDFKNLPSLADPFKGYLRFEFTLDDNALQNNFGSNYWSVIIKSNPNRFIQIAEDRLKRWFDGIDLTKMTKEEAISIIIKAYGVDYGTKLYGYLQIRDGDARNKDDFLSQISRTTKFRYNRDLKKVGVGLPSGIEFPSFRIPKYLVISSNYRRGGTPTVSHAPLIPVDVKKGEVFMGDLVKTGL